MNTPKLALAAAVAISGLAFAQAANTVTGPDDRQAQPAAGMQGGQQSQQTQQGQWSSQSQQSDQKKLSDKEFVKQAASGGLFEVESAKLAASKVGEEHKDHVKKIEEDHKKANDELKQIAQQKNLEMPSEVQGKHKEMLTELRGTSDDQFAKKFAVQQIKAHKEAIKLYEQAGRDLQDAELKQFAQRQLPKLQEHLATIQSNHPDAVAEAGMDSDLGEDAQPAGARIDVDAQLDRSPEPAVKDPALKDNQPGHTTHENPGENLNQNENR